jgi:hypothetical protein
MSLKNHRTIAQSAGFVLLLLTVLLLGCVPQGCIQALAASPSFLEDFQNDKVGQDPKSFASLVGDWYVSDERGNKVYAVDGRKWSKGKVASGVADKSRAIYGNRYAEFLDRVQAFAYYPLSIYKPVDNFKNGEISFRFKGVTGRIDQCAGIAFNVKPNGDYLIFRANCLENNIVLWKYERGKRTPIKWVYKIVTPPGHWMTLAMAVRGKRILGRLNGVNVFDFEYTEPIDGKVGLWSKADSVVYFDDFSVKKE